MSASPKFRAAAACGVAGPVAWTIACATFLFTIDLDGTGGTAKLVSQIGDPKVPFVLFGTLGLIGGLMGGGRWRALSTFLAGELVALLSILVLLAMPDGRLLAAFPMIAGPIMGVGYSLGARTGRKISKGAFAGLFAGLATSILVFLLFGALSSVFLDSALRAYLGGLPVSYVATFVFFAFYAAPQQRRPNGAAAAA